MRTEVRNSYEPALAHRTDLEIWKVAKLLDRRHGKSVVRQIKRGEVWEQPDQRVVEVDVVSAVAMLAPHSPRQVSGAAPVSDLHFARVS